jgi:hypothetical protein
MFAHQQPYKVLQSTVARGLNHLQKVQNLEEKFFLNYLKLEIMCNVKYFEIFWNILDYFRIILVDYLGIFTFTIFYNFF